MTRDEMKRLADACENDEAFQKEWAEIRQLAACGDEESEILVELNRRAAAGDEFSADLLYLHELRKLAVNDPPAKRMALMIWAMKQIAAKHNKRRMN
jgi:hypothetical protein